MRKTIFFLIIFLKIFLLGKVYSLDFKEKRSLHFIVKYNPSIEETYIRKIIKEAEKYYRLITHEFYIVRERPWLGKARAKIYIAQDKKEYKEKFPCPFWSQACVNYFQKKIYTYKNQKKFSSFLAHELAHIIFREYVGEKTLPLWIDEGMAIYIEAKYANPALENFLRKKTRKMIEKKKYIDFDKINKIKLKKNESNREFINLFYAQAWSMVNFLRIRFGKIKFKEYLEKIKEGKNVEEAIFSTYGLIDNNKDFERLWKQFYLR